jgi:DNA mismatch repair protein MutS2
MTNPLPPPPTSREDSAIALDWPIVLEALSTYARTRQGRRACLTLAACPDRRAIAHVHDAVAEVVAVERVGAPVPVGGVLDVAGLGPRAAKGEVLDAPTLKQVAVSLVALRDLSRWLADHAESVPVLAALGHGIDLRPDLVDLFAPAFDPDGSLSAAAFPELGPLRSSIRDLHASIRSTLEALVHGDALDDVLQDRFVTMRSDRYVVPIKAHAKRWDLGIVHGTSGSGRTVFVEPREVVELNNRLRLAEAALAAEERRILAWLSRELGGSAPEVERALDAALTIDLITARAGLALRLRAVRPAVGGDGTLSLLAARHPVLVLRGVDVVPSDVSLDADHPALVITGPNAGGKTVALKTVGLCALLVAHGMFVPAAEGTRVDHFTDLRALVGDHQGVMADLSSFSSHLVGVRAMLEAAGPGALLLADELGSGTDPAQGGALARAVIERLVETGARLVVTTHDAQPKALAIVDERVRVAAVEYRDGRPTWRLRIGVAGESHALDAARRAGLPEAVITRAEALLGDGERALSDAIGKVEQERGGLADEAARLQELAARLASRAEALDEREAKIEERQRALDARRTDAFAERLKQAERAIAQVVAELQRAPSHAGATAARATVEALRGLSPPPPPAPPPAEVVVGDRVRLRSGGQIGDVVEATDRDVVVQIGNLRVRADRSKVEPAEAAAPKRRRRPPPPPGKAPEASRGVPTPGNTVDLRGMRVDEAIQAAEAFVDRALRAGDGYVFVLHGHGTGAVKEAIRDHFRRIPIVARVAPANADQGGDAHTVLVLAP